MVDQSQCAGLTGQPSLNGGPGWSPKGTSSRLPLPGNRGNNVEARGAVVVVVVVVEVIAAAAAVAVTAARDAPPTSISPATARGWTAAGDCSSSSTATNHDNVPAARCGERPPRRGRRPEMGVAGEAGRGGGRGTAGSPSGDSGARRRRRRRSCRC